ncbi:MAG TPA: pilus assembly protein [Alphaproteobacteria bacterium]|nr:pilus assembly protein [Alphaproteobacteria bacterium]
MTSAFTCRLWRALRRTLDLLAREERGGIAIFLATAIVPLVGFLGLAVDTTRGYLVKARLSQALDAAGLAGGRVIYSATRDADIQMYFAANFPPDYMGATVTGPTVIVDPQSTTVTLEASAVVGTTFLRVLGINDMTVHSSVEVTREQQLLDLVLAIDVSGSMSSSAGSGQTRIQAARTAATTLVDILFGTDGVKDLLKIGLVPWNSKVNVTRNGVTFNSALTTFQTVPAFKNPLNGTTQTRLYYANNSPVPLLSAPPSGWKGCVYDRYKADGITGNDGDIVEAALTHSSGDWMGWEPIGAEGEPTSSGSTRCSAAPSGQECTACFTRGITSLQNTKTGITNAINQLITPDGNTNVPAGLAWAWRTLTPASPWTEADPNPQGRRQQAIVLLTDGENVGGYGDGYKAVFGINSAAQSSMDARTRLLAQNIKAAGVTVYVIQFANNNSSMQTLLKEIATKPDKPFYNYAPNAAALQTVFKEVANNLSELRLSK